MTQSRQYIFFLSSEWFNLPTWQIFFFAKLGYIYIYIYIYILACLKKANYPGLCSFLMEGFKSFVTEGELEEKRQKRQEEWERVRKPEDPKGLCY